MAPLDIADSTAKMREINYILWGDLRGIQMARGKLRFREREIARLVRAATRAGMSVGRVTVDQDGNLTVIAAEPEPEDHDGLTHEAAA